MTLDAHDAHVAILHARLQRVTRLTIEYKDDLNPLGRQLLRRSLFATAVDLGVAIEQRDLSRHHVSSAPPPPAESSPEDSSR